MGGDEIIHIYIPDSIYSPEIWTDNLSYSLYTTFQFHDLNVAPKRAVKGNVIFCSVKLVPSY